jgi:hypothetical protein
MMIASKVNDDISIRHKRVIYKCMYNDVRIYDEKALKGTHKANHSHKRVVDFAA